jgi:aryl-alcohol dehydrogenase-like predicted oxidoreductase
VIEGFRAFAEERGIAMLDVALGGLLAQPAIDTIISGVTRPEQVAANARAVQWQPTPEDLDAIDGIVAQSSGSGYVTYAPRRH